MPDPRALDEGLPPSNSVSCRRASHRDAEGIAAIHADSWRRHYRGAYLDSYLDGDVVADRVAVWVQRLSEPTPDRITLVADQADALVGFAHLIIDHDPRWGSFLENLHVVVDRKRQDIGSLLLSSVAGEILRSRPSGSLYLWVLDENQSAQAFYGARGGVRVGTELRGPFPGGGRAMGHRYAWSDPACLIPAQPGS